MTLTDEQLLDWMRDVAIQEHLGVRRILLLRPGTERIEVEISKRVSRLEPPTPHPNEVTAELHLWNVVEFLSSRGSFFLRATDGLIVVVPVGTTGGHLVAEAVGAGGTEGVLGVALSSLARFFAGEGPAPNLRRHRSN